MLDAIGRWSRCYDTTMDSFDHVAIFNFPLSFPIESVYEGDIKQLVRAFPDFPSVWCAALPGTPVFSMPFYRHQSVRRRDTTEQFPAGGVWAMNLWNWKAVCFPSPPPPILHFPPRFSTALLDSRVDHRGRNNVGEHAFERTLTTIRVDVCCYFFPRFQFSIRGKKNMAETLRRIQFRRCTFRGWRRCWSNF